MFSEDGPLLRRALVMLLLMCAVPVHAQSAPVKKVAVSEKDHGKAREGAEIPAALSAVAASGAFAAFMGWGAVMGMLAGPVFQQKPFLLDVPATTQGPTRTVATLATNAVFGMVLAVPVAGLMSLIADGVVWTVLTRPPGRSITIWPAILFAIAAVSCVPLALACAVITAFGMVSLRWERDKLERNVDKAWNTALFGAAVSTWILFPMLVGMAAFVRVAAWRGFLSDHEVTPLRELLPRQQTGEE
ncbi:MAG: hypothetical protein AB2A00_40075 [Myxococcota bacterium]